MHVKGLNICTKFYKPLRQWLKNVCAKSFTRIDTSILTTGILNVLKIGSRPSLDVISVWLCDERARLNSLTPLQAYSKRSGAHGGQRCIKHNRKQRDFVQVITDFLLFIFRFLSIQVQFLADTFNIYLLPVI